ncbi:SDR family oxidoreductase [Halieaceae bacterium IMCC8485]|jgi:NAD(P)-dependent dehydrogenase (short-subunit alcohol dehydrogenase family)|uniref:SDR family oxidoreductase n=1 Tax=Candidatus Seongchinamella marina TaxID=2518990 RepID=A0ABT3SZ51_9GAMM|nr:SDR family NAD(P)-dependent oxidoreductase [Candidatus Seongchinamella marina]MCX2974597.1 SDR family oxidoreductase [Candidatus Seongchinamella marina]
MSGELNDKVYIVTGGSQGFGLAIAKCLIDKGAKVGLLSRSKAGLDKAISDIGSDHACAISADVTRKSELVAGFEKVKSHFGRLDGLVNNAGMARPNRIENLVEDEVLMQVNTNYLGTVFSSQAAIPLLRGGENPRIVNISSASAYHYDEMSHLSIYASTKAAVERFTRDLASELQVDEIGVTCVRPGGAGTSFADAWDSDALMAGIEAWRDSGTYMNVGMETEQVGEAVAFALSQPAGVAIDLLELRPKRLMKKV